MRRLVLGQGRPPSLALLCQDSFREVDPFFQFANPLLQLIELTKTGLELLQRPAVRLVGYSGLALRQEPQQGYCANAPTDEVAA